MSDLLRAAVLGTAQGPADDPPAHPAVARLVAALPRRSRESRLLLVAGGEAVLRRAAGRPLTEVAPWPAAESDTRRQPGPRLRDLLDRVLHESDADLLEEALRRLDAAGIAWPPALLPRLLDAPASLRPLVRRAAGTRAAWLAAVDVGRAWLVDPGAGGRSPQETGRAWAEGSLAERRALLESVRVSDPELGTELLAATWKSDKAEQRLTWIEVLGRAPRPGDAALLESALGDRSDRVRIAAARVLWHLPDSDVARGVAQLAFAWVSHRPPRSGAFQRLRGLVGAVDRGGIEVVPPPETWDAAWQRLGIEEAAGPGVGRRRWWLAQAVSAVPPGRWCERTSLEPAQLVALAADHEWGDALLDGWTAAALRFDAADWIAPLYDAPERQDAPRPLVPHAKWELAGRLRPRDAGPRMIDAIARRDAVLLARFARPWPHDASVRFLATLADAGTAWTSLLATAARAIAPELLPDSLTAPSASDDYAAQTYLRALDRFLSVAGMRRALAREIPR